MTDQNPNDDNFDPALIRSEAENELARQMLHIYRAFNALAQEQYAKHGYHGLTAAHTSLMANLDRGGIRIVELAERMGLTKQFAGRLVQELLKMGFITTQPDPQDRRATLVKGTPAGWQYLLDACEVRKEIEQVFRNTLGDERLPIFLESIGRLAALNVDTSQSPEPLELLDDKS